MASARPVVATAVGGVVDVVKNNETGILLPPDGEMQLTEALRLLEADPLLRARLEKAGQTMVRGSFHQKVVIEKLSALYESLASKKNLQTQETC